VPAQLFQTKDGYVVLFITHDKFWRLFAESLDEPEWLSDPRFSKMSGRSANRDLVVSQISERLMQKTAEEWVEQLAALGLVVASICSLPDALEGPLSASRDMVIEIPVDGDKLRLIGSAIKIAGEAPSFRAPPALGEHSAQLLG
jgi:crotonobetainyl-CoA:carnitine CoA-transferase CaiB-like acyl-CoA transferase